MKTINLGKLDFSGRASQRGVGMVEVLVALLLLAIGVLGYAALQVRAVQATGDALTRSQAMVIVRGLAEGIRVNFLAQSVYPTAQAQFTNLTAPSKDCYSATCTSSQLAIFDAYQAAKTASNLGMKINMANCPGVSSAPSKRQCIYAAWGKTTLTNINPLPTTPSATDCMSSAGVYRSDATCVMMEAY